MFVLRVSTYKLHPARVCDVVVELEDGVAVPGHQSLARSERLAAGVPLLSDSHAALAKKRSLIECSVILTQVPPRKHSLPSHHSPSLLFPSPISLYSEIPLIFSCLLPFLILFVLLLLLLLLLQ